MTELQNYYLPLVDSIYEKYFPKYVEKTKNLPREQRRKIPLLSKKQQVEYYKKYKSGVYYANGSQHVTPDAMHARDMLIYSQLRLVYHYAQKFHHSRNGTNLSEEDIIGFANEILVDIIQGYDPFKGKSEEDIANGNINTLPTYIRNWLRNYLHKYLKDYGLLIRLPHNQINDMMLQRKILKQFYQRNGREPFDGENYEYICKGVLKYIFFDISNNEIWVEIGEGEQRELERVIKYSPENTANVVSGQKQINEEGDELFDLVEGDSNVSLDDERKLIARSIRKTLSTLSKRDEESIRFYYFDNKPLKDIPSLLTPNDDDNKEFENLAKTSENIIRISYRSNGQNHKIVYKVCANHHLKEEEYGNFRRKDVEFLSHKHKNIFTNNRRSTFKFNIKNATDIKIKHITKKNIIKYTKGSGDNTYSYDGNHLIFEVEYSYGEIFTSQTFLNKKEKLLVKLRKKLRHLNNIR